MVHTLGMVDMKRTLSEELKQEVEKCLQKFGVSMNQIYTITTDNGRNMIKACNLIQVSLHTYIKLFFINTSII